MENRKIYVLLRNSQIEEYYDVQSFIGVFSSREDIDHYFEVRKTQHEARLLEQFMKYRLDAGQSDLAKCIEAVERYEAEVSRKVVGSNGHKKASLWLDGARAGLEKAKNFKLLSWEEWRETQPKYSFNPELFEILETYVNEKLFNSK